MNAGGGEKVAAIIFGIYVIVDKIMNHTPAGYATLMLTILLTSSFQMVMMGVLGEYLWRNLNETRKRPLYVIDEVIEMGDVTVPNADEPVLQIGVYRYSNSAKWIYFAAALMLAAFSLTVLWGGGEKWTRRKAIGFILVICAVYILLFPAWNINDFGKHFATAYSYTNKILGVRLSCIISPLFT